MSNHKGIQSALEKARQRRMEVLDQPYGRRANDSRKKLAPVSRQSSAISVPSFALSEFSRSKCKKNRIILGETKVSKIKGVAEYRILRTRILQRARSNDWRTIAVTSPGPGEGKSVTSINLASAIAREQNNDVFLLDLDMRNPTLCEYIGAKPNVEVAKFLAGEAAPEDIFFSIGVERLIFAGSLNSNDHSSELLASGKLEELFSYIYQIAPNPIILLDLPPILSTDDALVVAPKVDACLLVVSEGVSRRDSTEKALELLSEYNLAGLVLNRSRVVVKDYYNS